MQASFDPMHDPENQSPSKENKPKVDKKRIWLILPSLFLPYLLLLTVSIIFFSPFLLEHFTELLQNPSAILLVIPLFVIYCLLCTIPCGLFAIFSVKNNWDELSIAKTSMIFKLVQIPAYIVIFVVGVLLFLGIWTIPVSIIFFIVDVLSVALTSIITISSIAIAMRNNKIQSDKAIAFIASQLFFCVDVLGAILYYRHLKGLNFSEK